MPVNYFRCAEGCVNLKFDGVAAVDNALLLRWRPKLIKLSER